MDYAMPRADDLPSLDLGFIGTRCTTNPLGVKRLRGSRRHRRLPRHRQRHRRCARAFRGRKSNRLRHPFADSKSNRLLIRLGGLISPRLGEEQSETSYPARSNIR